MVKYFKFISIISLVLFLGLGVFTQVVFAEGIVPCGIDTNSDGKVADEIDTRGNITHREMCNICDLIQLGDNIIDFAITTLMPVLATLMIIAGAMILITAGGSETQLSKGKDVIKNTIIGIVIVLASWLIIDTIMMSFTKLSGSGGGEWGPWNKIECN